MWAMVENDSIRIPGPGVPATLPVLEIRGEVQRLILPTANLDGSLTDLDPQVAEITSGAGRLVPAGTTWVDLAASAG